MQIPIQVSFHGMAGSDELEAACRREAYKLERYAQRITGCRVVISAPHQHRTKGNLYEIRIDLSLPQHEIVVNRVPTEHRADETLELALREAFDSARRRLQDEVRKQSGAVKAHEIAAHGHVVRLLPDERCGFIETPDHREVYFNASSLVTSAFDALALGTEVRFVEEQGLRGPQATSLSIVGKHHQLPR